MANLTDRAGALLERIQTEQSLPHPLRIELAENPPAEEEELVIGLSDPAPDDDILYHGDTAVLYLSAAAAELLTDCTLTTRETPEGTTLAVVESAGPDADPSRRDGRWPAG